jgi:hypothetical protein
MAVHKSSGADTSADAVPVMILKYHLYCEAEGRIRLGKQVD